MENVCGKEALDRELRVYWNSPQKRSDDNGSSTGSREEGTPEEILQEYHDWGGNLGPCLSA